MSEQLPSGSNRNKVEYLAQQVADLQAQLAAPPKQTDEQDVVKIRTLLIHPNYDSATDGQKAQTVDVWDFYASSDRFDYHDTAENDVLRIDFLRDDTQGGRLDLSLVTFNWGVFHSSLDGPEVMVLDKNGSASMKLLNDIAGNSNYNSEQNNTSILLVYQNANWHWVGGYVSATEK